MINGIGFAGRMKAGKDTAAVYANNMIHSLKGSNNTTTHLAFAAPLKSIAMDYMGLTSHECYDQTGKAKFNEFWGMTNRELLQRLGDGMRKEVHPDFWTKIAEQQLKECVEEGTMFFVTDVRYPNEAELIRRYGGIVVQIKRDEVEPPEGHIDHPSERPLDPEYVDEIIYNNGTLEDLRSEVCRVINKYTHQ